MQETDGKAGAIWKNWISC